MAYRGATAQGSAAYAARFANGAAGHFRAALGLTLSSLGLGTYLGRDDDATDRAYREAVVAAVSGGVNVLDSASNYRFQRSERAIGGALSDLAARGYGRAEIVVATKAGYVPSRDPQRYFQEQIVGAGHARAEDLVAGCHCLAPGYLRHQLEASLTNLGVRSVDIHYLHNPEQQLDEVAPAVFTSRLRAAFETLEAAVEEGKIGVYGTATWNGYRVPAESPGALALEPLVQLAREVAGEGHHFRVVQLPFNLSMPEAFTQTTQVVAGEALPLLEAAGRLGVSVMTSASILQGRLARGLPETLHAAFPGLASDALRAIQFARSAPGVTTALVGMSRVAHVRENLAILNAPPLAPEAFEALFRGA